MKQFKVIDQICLKEGKLKCKKPSNRSFQKAHFKHGDLDGACGAYLSLWHLIFSEYLKRKNYTLIQVLIAVQLNGSS